MDTKPQGPPHQHTELSTNEARQGQTGMHVRAVLGFGLAGVIIGFVVVYLVFFV